MPTRSNARAGTWVFAQTGEHNTLGLAATFDAAEESQDLPIQLTLGEDNGLRGYPARELAGSRRLRVNLENRLDTGVEYATLRLGFVAFADAGWAGEGSALGRPYEAVGLGLRLGSKPLLGDGVLRIDLARRLVAIEGDDDEWMLSVSVGQVFMFGGNASPSSLR